MNGVNWMTFSDIWLEDADYVKIQNVTLGYDFKRLWKKCPFGQLRLYVQAQNLYTFTGYSGLDPEVFGGIDNNIYPRSMTSLVGLSLQF